MNAEASTLIVPEPSRQRRESLPVAPDATIMTVIASAARDPQIDADKMLKLYEIRERELARQAKAAFADAMAQFKANPPKIVKDKHVAFDTGKGRTEYDHATLGHICDEIIEGLAAVGISHRWDLDQQDGGMTVVTCVLTHRDGHETRTPLRAGLDSTGSKNNIQSMGSTVSYLQRYTLMAATGLAAGMPDDDGRGGADYERITDNQAADIEALLQEVGANRVAFLSYLKIDEIEDIAAKDHEHVVRMIEAKRKQPVGGRK